MSAEVEELLGLERAAMRQARMSMREGDLEGARAWVEMAVELLRQHAELTGEHLDEFGESDLDRGL